MNIFKQKWIEVTLINTFFFVYTKQSSPFGYSMVWFFVAAVVGFPEEFIKSFTLAFSFPAPKITIDQLQFVQQDDSDTCSDSLSNVRFS